MYSFHERKQERKEYFERFVKGWRLQDCTACAGSGRYDDGRNRRCGGCEGTGKERIKIEDKIKHQFIAVEVYHDRRNEMPKGFVAVFATRGGLHKRYGIWFLVPAPVNIYNQFIVDPKIHKRIKNPGPHQ